MDIKYLRFFYDEVTLLSCLICRHSVWFRDLIFTFEVSGLNCYFSGNIKIRNVDCWDIKILSYSVAFIKKINLLHLHHWHFPRKVCIFQRQPREMFYAKKLFWNILQYSQESCRLATLLKRDSNTGVFLWVLRNFWEHVFWIALVTAGSEFLKQLQNTGEQLLLYWLFC